MKTTIRRLALGVGLLILIGATPCSAQESKTEGPRHPAIAMDPIRWDAPVRLGHRWRRVVVAMLGAFDDLTRLPPPPTEDDVANPFFVPPAAPVATGGDAWIHLTPHLVTLGPAMDGRSVNAALPGFEVRLPSPKP